MKHFVRIKSEFYQFYTDEKYILVRKNWYMHDKKIILLIYSTVEMINLPLNKNCCSCTMKHKGC